MNSLSNSMTGRQSVSGSTEKPSSIKAPKWRVKQEKYFYIGTSVLLSLCLVVLTISLMLGAFPISLQAIMSFGQENSMQWTVLTEIRLPRVLMTIVTGAGIALCGLILQSVLKNPLADPGLIGVSAGAALFAAIAFVLLSTQWFPASLAPFAVPVMAFIGAGISLFTLMSIASHKGQFDTLLLILAGVAVNTAAMTALGFINFIADDSTLRQITFWSMGSYAGIDYVTVGITLAVIAPAWLTFWLYRNSIMRIAINEKQAKYQGVNTEAVKLKVLLLCAAVVAVCVCFTGIVGFVGLVIPHICRMIFGANLRILLVVTPIAGAILVASADTVARMIISPNELPVGLVTSLVGIPFFVFLLLQYKRRSSYV